MSGTILRSGLCGVGVLILVGVSGCQPQNGSSGTALGTEGAGGTVIANQGRFPAPVYSQDAQPAYALTGENSAQQAWAPFGSDYQVGNGRITIPAAP